MKSHKCDKPQSSTETDSWATSYLKPLTTYIQDDCIQQSYHFEWKGR